jgi:ribose 5-phosphate isomerase B
MNNSLKSVGIASDHAGYGMKQQLITFLRDFVPEIKDFGTDSAESMDYPDVAHPLAVAVENGSVDMGIALCGSGNGVCMTLNKHQKIRAALCWNEELARLARLHNDANIICIPARFTELPQAREMTKIFLETPFEGGRHSNRVNKIKCE